MSGCKAQPKGNQQTKEREQKKSSAVERTVVVIGNCWKEFKDSTANVSVKFCGEPQKDILNVIFNGKNIKLNSYMVLDTEANGNARYFLQWFDWKLKNDDAETLRNFYDACSEDVLNSESKGSIKETKEIFFNGKIGRETTFVAENSNSLTIRLFYSNGKVIRLGFLPDELATNKLLQEKSRNIFYDSLKILK